jgi:hypothetical protein
MSRPRIYLGYHAGESRREIFRSATVPTEESHGKRFTAVVGPFRTVRGAKAMLWFGFANPHLRTVTEAEKIGKCHFAELTALGTAGKALYVN